MPPQECLQSNIYSSCVHTFVPYQPAKADLDSFQLSSDDLFPEIGYGGASLCDKDVEIPEHMLIGTSADSFNRS